MSIDILIESILMSLREIRVSLVSTEYILQDIIKNQFEKHNIKYIKEYKIAPRKRVDFFIDSGIIIEVKKGSKRPNRTKVLEQLEKYSFCEEVKVIIYVGEKNVSLPGEINGKKCIAIGLNKNWGVSL
jgi:acetyl-CoA carboxylase carboxyltransferase component